MSATFAEPQADGSVKLRCPLGSGDWLLLGIVPAHAVVCTECHRPIGITRRFRLTAGTRVGAIYMDGQWRLAHRDSKVCESERLSQPLTRG